MSEYLWYSQLKENFTISSLETGYHPLECTERFNIPQTYLFMLVVILMHLFKNFEPYFVVTCVGAFP